METSAREQSGSRGEEESPSVSETDNAQYCPQDEGETARVFAKGSCPSS